MPRKMRVTPSDEYLLPKNSVYKKGMHKTRQSTLDKIEAAIPLDADGKRICGAKLRPNNLGAKGDGICHRIPMLNGRCTKHGGHARFGSTHPNFKTGEYSRYPTVRAAATPPTRYGRSMPLRLTENYLRSLDDPNKLALDHEIAAIDTRINELFTKLDVEGSDLAWQNALSTMEDLYNASKAGDGRTATQKMLELRSVLRSGNDDIRYWAQIQRLSEQRRKLVETETRRIQAAQETMTAAQATSWANNILTVIKTHVTDPTVLTAISRDIVKLSGPAYSSGPQSSNESG